MKLIILFPKEFLDRDNYSACIFSLGQHYPNADEVHFYTDELQDQLELERDIKKSKKGDKVITIEPDGYMYEMELDPKNRKSTKTYH